MKIIYDTLNKPTLVNDIHDTFSPQADFIMAFNQMNLLGLRKKLTIRMQKTSPLNQAISEETWDLNL